MITRALMYVSACLALVLILLTSSASAAYSSSSIFEAAKFSGSDSIGTAQRLTGQPRLSSSYRPGELLVKFKQTGASLYTGQQKNAVRFQYSAELRARFPDTGIELWRLSSATDDVIAAAAALSREDAVLYAEPNYIIHIDRIPDDPFFSLLWGLHNTGQFNGTPGADCAATAIWNRCTGNGVIAAVVDTGIDYTHFDLANNMWMNPGETGMDASNHDKRFNGIDDDSNGYVDDVYGIDSINGDSDPMGDHYHGTHCAGTIAGIGNNATGVVGVCWSARLMALKAFDATGDGDVADAIECIEYAINKNARVINCSFGFSDYSQALSDVIALAGASNILLCASAGNDAQNLDQHPQYPAAYPLANILSIAATDMHDGMSPFSNYSSTKVDLGAPGSEIFSTAPDNSFKYASGTSMSSPHCTGAAALLLSLNSSLSALDVKSLLMNGADPIPALTGKCVSGGRLNVWNAGKMLCGLFCDRDKYFTGSPVLLTAVFTNMPAVSPPAVSITTDEGDAETLSLLQAGSGVFMYTNAIDLMYGTAIPGNGILEGRHGTHINAVLSDATNYFFPEANATVSLLLDITVTTSVFRVPYQVQSVSLAGTVNGTVPVTMTISNAANGRTATFTGQYGWTSPSLQITGGVNTITLYGTNSFGFYDRHVVSFTQLGPSGITNYVSKTSSNPLWPYSSWDTAAHTIGDALAASFDGNPVLVTDGTYNEPEIIIDVAARLQSVNGSDVTIIDGGGSHRCMTVNANAIIDGFTVKRGSEMSFGGGATLNHGLMRNCLIISNNAVFTGGGGFCLNDARIESCSFRANQSWLGGGVSATHNSSISNCFFSYNYAGVGGGAAILEINAQIYDSQIVSNSSTWNGGVFLRFGGTAENCLISANQAGDGGGGVHCLGGGFVNRCIITDNSSDNSMNRGGGGVFFHTAGGRIANSLIAGNTSRCNGGGASVWEGGGELINCTISDNNAATNGGGVYTDGSTLIKNSIMYGNTARQNNEYNTSGGQPGFAYTCTHPLPSGTGNQTNDPLFVASGYMDFRLQAGSACIDAGLNADVVGSLDLDGNPRIEDSTVDMGAYEFIPEPGLMMITILLAGCFRKVLVS